jgi:hypothetical protein
MGVAQRVTIGEATAAAIRYALADPEIAAEVLREIQAEKESAR